MKFSNILLALICSIPMFGQQFTHYTESDGLVNNSVNCIAIDANQSVWLGTNNGISKFDGFEWISDTTNLINNNVTALFTSSTGDLWVGTDDGISVLSESIWSTHTEQDGLGDNRVSSINEDANGVIWVGEKEGLSRFDGTTWSSYSMSDGLPFGGVKYVTFDSNNELWLANNLYGLIHFNGNSFTIYDTEAGLVSNKVTSIAIDQDDTKWIGTSQGISVLDANNQVLAQHTMMLLLPEPDTLNPVVDIKIDSQGNVWTGIYVDYLVNVGGVAAWNGSLWSEFANEEVLVGPVVRALAIDGNDNVWVGTSSGFTKMSGVSLSVSPISVSSNLEIYPNPTRNVIHFNERVKGSIRIYNPLGHLVLKQATDKGLNKIYVEDLSNSIYILKSDNGASQKLIIKHD